MSKDKVQAQPSNEALNPLFPSSGFEAVQGRRWNMEDTHIYIDDLRSLYPGIVTPNQDSKMSFYSVFDGHGGKIASHMAEECVLQKLIEDDEFKKGNYAKAMRNAYLKADQAMMEKALADKWTDGCTGISVLIVDKRLFIANVGDSEAVLARRKPEATASWESIVLSAKHTPSSDSERDRLAKAGASIIQGRVQGVLAVSRAFGDMEFKMPTNNASVNFVTAEPHVASIELCDLDEFMIMACDGLWDVFKYHDAVNMVASSRWNGKSTWAAADHLVKESIERKTSDNVTAIVVYLQPVPESKKKSAPVLSTFVGELGKLTLLDPEEHQPAGK